jgi:hypothetical protein
MGNLSCGVSACIEIRANCKQFLYRYAQSGHPSGLHFCGCDRIANDRRGNAKSADFAVAGSVLPNFRAAHRISVTQYINHISYFMSMAAPRLAKRGKMG